MRNRLKIKDQISQGRALAKPMGSGFCKGQGANRRRGGMSQHGQQGKNSKRKREREHKGIGPYKGPGGAGKDQQIYGRVGRHDRRKYTGRNNVRFVRGNKKLAGARCYNPEDCHQKCQMIKN
jgi:hypothetical protein